MGTLGKAIAAKNWELAAHIIVYAAARSIVKGEIANDRETDNQSQPETC